MRIEHRLPVRVPTIACLLAVPFTVQAAPAVRMDTPRAGLIGRIMARCVAVVLCIALGGCSVALGSSKPRAPHAHVAMALGDLVVAAAATYGAVSIGSCPADRWCPEKKVEAPALGIAAALFGLSAIYGFAHPEPPPPPPVWNPDDDHDAKQLSATERAELRQISSRWPAR